MEVIPGRSKHVSSNHQWKSDSLFTTHVILMMSLSYWCFKPTQPQRIISGLRKTFIKRHIVERTNKAEQRSEEESGKAESFGENLWNEIQLKGP